MFKDKVTHCFVVDFAATNYDNNFLNLETPFLGM